MSDANRDPLLPAAEGQEIRTRREGAGGALYIVATPIGNLEDITYRAVRVLKEVGVIACEDTRQTQKLLNHYAISTRTISNHEHNEVTRSAELVKQMEAGTSVALVTDAGMPGISDPGFRLISLAIERGLPVIPLPGASAFLAALVASGLPTHSFRFNGFLPAKGGERRAALESIKDCLQTQIFYEAPHRIVESVADVCAILGNQRQVVVAREVTKLHEEFLRGSAGKILEDLKARDGVKGEITLLIGKLEASDGGNEPKHAPATIRERVEEIMHADGVDQKTALKKIAKERGISKSEAYRDLQRSGARRSAH